MRDHGSQPDMCWLVNNNTEEFKEAIRNCRKGEWDGAEIDFLWPLKGDNYAEYSITDHRIWSRLGIGCPDDIKIHKFWPSSGAKWDAAAILTNNGEKTLLLFEAKAHKGELISKKNKNDLSDKNRNTIIKSIEKAWVDIARGGKIDNWLCSYQFANRVAHAKQLNNENVKTALIYVLFCNEQSRFNDCTDKDGWIKKLDDEYKIMGLSNGAKEIQNFYHIVYPIAPSMKQLIEAGIDIDKEKYVI